MYCVVVGREFSDAAVGHGSVSGVTDLEGERRRQLARLLGLSLIKR